MGPWFAATSALAGVCGNFCATTMCSNFCVPAEQRREVAGILMAWISFEIMAPKLDPVLLTGLLSWNGSRSKKWTICFYVEIYSVAIFRINEYWVLEIMPTPTEI